MQVSPLNYAFAIGKIRSLEKFLIKPAVFQEAIESNLAEALKLFVEANLYSEALLHIKDSQQLEEVLNEELRKLKKLISDLLLDKGLIDLLDLDDLASAQKCAKSYGSQFLEDYLKYLIDMHNIKTFLRLYILKEPPEKLNQLITCQGLIEKEVFLKLYSQDLTAFLHRLEYVHKESRIINYAYFLREAIQKLVKVNSFVALEKAINDFLISAIKPAKYLTFGPEPLLAYYFGKRNEINLIRMIILSKLNNVSQDLVKARLNSVYA